MEFRAGGGCGVYGSEMGYEGGWRQEGLWASGCEWLQQGLNAQKGRGEARGCKGDVEGSGGWGMMGTSVEGAVRGLDRTQWGLRGMAGSDGLGAQ